MLPKKLASPDDSLLVHPITGAVGSLSSLDEQDVETPVPARAFYSALVTGQLLACGVSGGSDAGAVRTLLAIEQEMFTQSRSGGES